ncbi:hypothetical protein G6F68_017149 [Rhizopus microsporus]|nr:hypothetical protein G6F68_017149 [Rhizopus microsporus]
MVHHLLVEVGDAPGGFRGRNHLAGRQHRAIGLAQSQQQLVLRGVAAGDGDDRLIGQLQLAFQQRQMLLRRACRVVRSTASRALLASSNPEDSGA